MKNVTSTFLSKKTNNSMYIYVGQYVVIIVCIVPSMIASVF